MTLLQCPDCTGALSSTATACTQCGYRPTAGRKAIVGRIPTSGWGLLLVLSTYAATTVALIYLFPQWYVLIGVAAIVWILVTFRRGTFRKA